MDTVRLGLRENLGPFALLVAVNGLVGAMVGLERSILPAMAEDVFHLDAHGALVLFVAVFGISKALTNLVAGRLADRFGRKPVLVAGWMLAVPVPLLLIWAPSWTWVLVANALLGVSQGLAWSATVIMKIDLAGPRQRGLAMGINEFAGYLAVAVSALLTAWIADAWGLRPAPFLLGVGVALLGLLTSLLAVGETWAHAALEALGTKQTEAALTGRQVMWRTSVADPTLSAASQAGLVNNLNDGMAWVLFPLLFAERGMSLVQIGVLAALYPAAWGMLQLVTGPLSDRIGRKGPIVLGMLTQAVGLGVVALGHDFGVFAAGSLLLGTGTALVYPTLLAAVSDASAPGWRASAVGVYRLWRDLGYAVGAVVAGVIADAAGLGAAVDVVAGLTLVSGLVVLVRMPGERVLSLEGSTPSRP